MSDNVNLGWKATITPNPNGNWVRFSGSTSQTESGVGQGKKIIMFDENTFVNRKEAVVTVVQDESNITKQFSIVQDKKCFLTVDISNDENKKIGVCGNSEPIVCDGQYSGFTIPADSFGPNCSTSERIVATMVNSEMACSGSQVKVIAKQDANEDDWDGYNVTAQTSPSPIVLPYEGGSVTVRASATRARKYTNCNTCPKTYATEAVTITWVHDEMNPTDSDISVTETFIRRVNEQDTYFTFTATQKGPDCSEGWVNYYEYNTDNTVEILSLYSGNTVIYVTSAARYETIPDWLEGRVTFQFPYLQRYTYGACDCSDGCEWRASDVDGIIDGEIVSGNTMFKCEGDVNTNVYTHTFTFTGDSGTEYMGRDRSIVDYSSQPFTVRALENTQVSFNSKIGNKIEFSVDKGGAWIPYQGAITVSKGFTVMFRCTSDAPIDSVTDGIGNFHFTGNVSVEGNVMSLIYGSDFIGKTEMRGVRTFYHLFYYSDGSKKVIASNKLVLPATTLTKSCYDSMFAHCDNMIIGPEVLPAEIVEESSYAFMFAYCEKMASCPAFNATKVKRVGCQYMFFHCDSFTNQIPDDLIFNVTEAGELAFWGFFEGCSNMTKGVKFPQLMEMPKYCFSHMYKETKLVESPNITIDKLNSLCYMSMFEGVSTLSKITISTDFPEQVIADAFSMWVSGVSANGVFYKPSTLADERLPRGINGIPYNWDVIET